MTHYTRMSNKQDAEALAAIDRACHFAPWTVDAFRGLPAAQQVLCYVVPDAKTREPLGFVVAEAPSKHCLIISRLAVRPDRQRQGVGRRLVAQVVAHARMDKMRVRALVHELNEPAIAFFAAMGFESRLVPDAFCDRDGVAMVMWPRKAVTK